MGRTNHSRRGFLAALAACALAPVGAPAAGRVYVIGYLSGGGRPNEFLTRPLAELGYVEGRNLRFDVKAPPNWEAPTLAAAANELVAAKPDVLIGFMGWRVQALANATRTIPIVSLGTADPVGEGLVQSLRKPGGNVTGLSLGLRESAEATMRLLRRLRPTLRRAAMLYAADPKPPFFEHSARAVGLEPAYIRLGNSSEAERAMRPFANEALLIAPAKDKDEELQAYAKAAYAARIAIVGTSPVSLLMYDLDFVDPMRRAAAIIDKVLRGRNPAEIPLETPDRSKLQLNRRVARELGLQIPSDVLLRVTEFVD